MANKYSSEIVSKAIEQWHLTDAIKMMLITAIPLVEETSKFRLSGEHIIGAQRVVSKYLDALLGVAELTCTKCNVPELVNARDRIREVAGRVQLQEYSEANRCIGEALQLVTTCAGRAAEVLVEARLWSQHLGGQIKDRNNHAI